MGSSPGGVRSKGGDGCEVLNRTHTDGHSTGDRAHFPHPGPIVSVTPAWCLCQHFEVDTSFPDAVMETKRWGNRRGPEELWGKGHHSLAHPAAHLSQLIIAVMAQRNRVGPGN